MPGTTLLRCGRVHALLAALTIAGTATVAGCQPLAAPEGSGLPQPVADVPALPGIKPVTVLEGLNRPWGIAWLPDNRALITEKGGTLRIARIDGDTWTLDPAPVSGVPQAFSGGQGGLMDVSLHPRFADNKLVYLTLSTGTRESNRTVLVRGTLDGSALSNVQTIFTVSQSKPGGQHFGSRLLWLPDGTVLLAIGDGGNPPTRLNDDLIRNNAQSTSSHLGKVLRLNDDGTAPKDNPFAAQAGADPHVWSIGHRNIQGLAADAAGRLWATEHGARGGDELNLLSPGGNFGWPKATFSREYVGPRISENVSLPDMLDAKVVWTPSIAPSGLAIPNAGKVAALNGKLLAGGLISRDVRVVTIEGDKAAGQQKISIGQRVRDVRQGPDGFVYVLTDEAKGRVVRLVAE